jgi:hypothetical protein
VCQTSRLSHLLDNRLTDGGEDVSRMRRPPQGRNKCFGSAVRCTTSCSGLNVHCRVHSAVQSRAGQRPPGRNKCFGSAARCTTSCSGLNVHCRVDDDNGDDDNGHSFIIVRKASNKNEYQKAFLRGKVRPARKAEKLRAIYEPIVLKMGKPRHLKACKPPWPVIGIALFVTLLVKSMHIELCCVFKR